MKTQTHTFSTQTDVILLHFLDTEKKNNAVVKLLIQVIELFGRRSYAGSVR